MALLLDTNVIIWWRQGDARISGAVADRLLSGRETSFVSVVSAWEYGQKRRKYPAEFPDPFDVVLAGFPHERLPLAFELHYHAETLPAIHGDPFDRMLIAQALHHGLTLVASDEMIRRYPVTTFW